MTYHLRFFGWPLILATMTIPGAVSAETQAVFVVSATIQPGCAVASVADGQWGRIDFGSVPGTSEGPVEVDLVGTSAGGIAVECTPGTTASVSVDQGLNSTAGLRHLARSDGGGVPIPYRLLLGAEGIAWDSQTLPLVFTGTQKVKAVALRGRAILSRAQSAGMYSDTVSVTITW